MTAKGDGQSRKTASPRRIALVVCNGTFSKMPEYRLVGPAKDATLLRNVLSDSDIGGFEVITIVDRGLLEVRREIARVCREADADDTLLIYYSGNGVTLEDGYYYLMVEDSEPDFLDATGLDAEFVLSRLRRSRCRNAVLIVDACHAGAFFNGNRGIPDGLYAITSCGAEQFCVDTPEGGGFTRILVSGLRSARADRDGDGLVSIDELHHFIERQHRTDGASADPQKWVWNVRHPIYLTRVPKHVFLSYARADRAAAEQIEKLLAAEGLAVWIDREGIQSGSWKERVTEGLNRARALVVWVTPNSLASDAVRKELAFASAKKVPILPVVSAPLASSEFPDWYMLDYSELHRHVLDSTRLQESVHGLADAIRDVGGQPEPVGRASARPTALPQGQVRSSSGEARRAKRERR